MMLQQLLNCECMMQVVSGTAAGDVHACCLPLQQGAEVHVPEPSAEDSTVHSTQHIGALTAPVRDTCPANTTGLAITAQGGVCASFSSSLSKRREHKCDDVACWKLCCTSASIEASSLQDTLAMLQPDALWWLQPVPRAYRLILLV